MIITQLKIKNFRNYENCILNLDKGIHFIVGKNGQGKTNLLESIYYLSCTRSHRTMNQSDLIRKESPFFMLEAMIEKKGRKENIRCVVNEKGKNLYFYQTPVKKVSDFIGTLNAVMFDPSDMFLFESSPKNRRFFIDLELGKISRSYTGTLNTYYHLLKERNTCLKMENINFDYLSVLENQMIESQVTIIEQRQKFVNDIINNSTYFYQKLSNDDTKISCIYQSFVPLDDKKTMIDAMKQRYKKNKERDLLYKTSNGGIHRDDFIFLLNGEEISSFASQGQKRSVLLSLKLGIAKTIFLLTKSFPILLFDDVFSELDENRRNRLLLLLNEEIKENQVFISSTDKIKLNKKSIHYWIVNDGNIKRMKEDE